ncbi:MAG: helix-turn-helix domain-containing protein [Burkholderiaceae bacterium]|nr:helix-turn-helix domain-containing protein [Burkholderiaceae bacterium]
MGGTTAVARLFGVKAPSVHAWRESGIPDDKLIRLAPLAEQRGVASRRELRPDDWAQIWPELAHGDAALPELAQGEAHV